MSNLEPMPSDYSRLPTVAEGVRHQTTRHKSFGQENILKNVPRETETGNFDTVSRDPCSTFHVERRGLPIRWDKPADYRKR